MSKRKRQKGGEQLTSLERSLNADRKLGLELMRMLVVDVLHPFVPAMIRKMDADTELVAARTRQLDRPLGRPFSRVGNPLSDE